ncbi:MAG TPA: hypothetical protein VJU01_08575 [Gaiellaceae bacterium]|nr:hypothetical protein [Gaiellaceae bacterium]
MGRLLLTIAVLAVTAAALSAQAAAARVPRVTVQPETSVPGGTVTVTGKGFCAERGCSAVRIQIYGVPVAIGVVVSPAGKFKTQVRLPGGGPRTGEVGVVAVQTLPDGSQTTGFAPFKVVFLTSEDQAREEAEREAEGEGGPIMPSEENASGGGSEAEAEREAEAEGGQAADSDALDADTAAEALGPIDEEGGGERSVWLWLGGIVGAALLLGSGAAYAGRLYFRRR